MTNANNFLKKRFARTSTFTAEEVVDELILVRLQPDTHSFQDIFTLNAVGARIWALLDGERPVEQIRDVIVEDFEIGPEQAEADLIAFLKQLEQVGAVQVA